MSKQATPTMTLAKLYETQGQSIDALAIYEQLFATDPSDTIKEKITELKHQIFTQHQNEYNSLINKIFSTEEKESLLILPHSIFITYKEAQEQDILNKIETLDKIPEPETDLPSPFQPLENAEIFQPNTDTPGDNQTNTQENISKENLNLESYDNIIKKIEDHNNLHELITKMKGIDTAKLKIAIKQKLGNSININEIKLSDLLEIIESINKHNHENNKNQ